MGFHYDWLRVFRALALLLPLLAAPATAQTGSTAPNGVNDLAVATRVVPPFVIRDGSGELSGFSVDLWRAIASEAGIRSHLQPYSTLIELLDAVRSGGNPVGISAVSITAEREKTLDFSQPMFRSGLQIMVASEGGGMLDWLNALLSPRLYAAIGLALVALLVPAHVAWLTHRLSGSSHWPVSRSYWPGVAQAYRWTAEKVLLVAEGRPGGAAGWLFNYIWTFTCLAAFASVTGLLASAMTLSSLRTDIKGPNDLAGKRVAAVSGSTAVPFLRALNASVMQYPNFVEAAAAVSNGADQHDAPVAVVYDAPVMQYFVNNDATHKFSLVGAPFKTENYGVIFPLNSELRHSVNAALLKLTENGTYQQISEKWFGKPSAQ